MTLNNMGEAYSKEERIKNLKQLLALHTQLSSAEQILDIYQKTFKTDNISRPTINRYLSEGDFEKVNGYYRIKRFSEENPTLSLLKALLTTANTHIYDDFDILLVSTDTKCSQLLSSYIMDDVTLKEDVIGVLPINGLVVVLCKQGTKPAVSTLLNTYLV